MRFDPLVLKVNAVLQEGDFPSDKLIAEVILSGLSQEVSNILVAYRLKNEKSNNKMG